MKAQPIRHADQGVAGVLLVRQSGLGAIRQGSEIGGVPPLTGRVERIDAPDQIGNIGVRHALACEQSDRAGQDLFRQFQSFRLKVAATSGLRGKVAIFPNRNL